MNAVHFSKMCKFARANGGPWSGARTDILMEPSYIVLFTSFERRLEKKEINNGQGFQKDFF